MGFFSRAKTDFSYSLLRSFIGNAYKDLLERGPQMERFDIFCEIWPEAATRVGAVKVIADRDQYMKFIASFANPQSSITFATQWLAMATLLGFSKTRFGDELRECWMAYEVQIRRDHGVTTSSHFAQLNPAAHLSYVCRYRREPFTDEDAEMLAEVQRLSHTLK
jgi:hypothetical protein